MACEGFTYQQQQSWTVGLAACKFSTRSLCLCTARFISVYPVTGFATGSVDRLPKVARMSKDTHLQKPEVVFGTSSTATEAAPVNPQKYSLTSCRPIVWVRI
ncbi:hypothetical protein PtA15_1A974 [Puccinia triticina]|uniref:Uncharacterized protein n=1 Tax=Puccinia triticina TaxID=208348 RepID=A0ABY7CCI8_9BASI|nr:uncharacterized protein PtA15_1A974 [Puccinia triticina]WAQ81632.1 hypothetical protein PtA15_1A974 [Puccinia triticina]WAR52520.1 hypothetical protein PtB15_1B962 [Puccinia triticina]